MKRGAEIIKVGKSEKRKVSEECRVFNRKPLGARKWHEKVDGGRRRKGIK